MALARNVSGEGGLKIAQAIAAAISSRVADAGRALVLSDRAERFP